MLNDSIKNILHKKIVHRIANIQDKVDTKVTFRCCKKANDQEEVLRILMVKCFPKLKRKDISCDVRKCFDLFFSIDMETILEDIRYFDLYNNFYEIIDESFPDYKSFINNYYYILLQYEKLIR